MDEPGLLVVFGEPRSGRRALAAAAASKDRLTVLAIAPRGEPHGGCAGYTGALDEAIADAARRDLDAAREILAGRAGEASFVLLRTRCAADVAEWAVRVGVRRAVVAARRGPRRSDATSRALSRAGIAVSVAR
ncbi:MAG TPA: hypothetical protein VID68_00485 [Solirubrobacteraceae bacterium]|jgi:hypothetical protein